MLEEMVSQSTLENPESGIVDILLGKTFILSCETDDGVDNFISSLNVTVNSLTSFTSRQDSHEINEEYQASSILFTDRQRSLAGRAIELIKRGIETNENLQFEISADYLRRAADEIGNITGSIQTEVTIVCPL